jgi:putative transposase
VNVYPFIEAEKLEQRNVKRVCELLQVCRAGYYAARDGQPSRREQDDADLTEAIEEVHRESKGRYGAPRIHAELHRAGRRHGKKRIARLMRQARLHGRTPKRWKKTTIADPAVAARADLVRRDFSTNAAAINSRWCGDITYIATWEGWLYLATVIDIASRRVVGFAMADHLRTELVADALSNAVAARNPAAGLIFHSDRGVRADSTGRRNASSRRCRDGYWSETDARSCLSGADPVSGEPDCCLAGGPGQVLGRDRSGSQDRGCVCRGGRVGPGRVPMVPTRWRRESVSAADGVGPLLVLCRAREHRAAAGAGCRRS